MPLHSKRIREDMKDAYVRQTPNRRDGDPLDGSTSGTIGGGGPETGGRTDRADAPPAPPVKPENAASGRRAPDPLAATIDRDIVGSGPSDVSNANTSGHSDDDETPRKPRS
jgi:hypothetical protein